MQGEEEQVTLINKNEKKISIHSGSEGFIDKAKKKVTRDIRQRIILLAMENRITKKRAK